MKLKRSRIGLVYDFVLLGVAICRLVIKLHEIVGLAINYIQGASNQKLHFKI